MAARAKRSNIWFHFTEDTSECRAKCNHCSLYLSTKSGSLGNLNRHMKNKHPTISLKCHRQPAITPLTNNNLPSTSSDIQDSALNIPVSNSGSEQLNTITNYIRRPPSLRKVDQIDNQVVRMVVKGHHALRMVEEAEFKKLVEMVSNCPGYQLPTRKTLSTTLVPRNYVNTFDSIQKKLLEAQYVCLCTDGWTSLNNKSFISVTAHFIDARTQLNSALLGCISYNERHTSSNLFAFLKQIICDWQINHKIVCIVSDNAANILGAVRLGEWRSIGCFAHSLNLVVQQAISTISPTINKVKSIVEYFKKSTAGLNKLQDIQKQMGLPPLKLKQECPTRWNSCFDMLDRILKIKEAVISTLAILKNDLSLQPLEWVIIEQVIPILEPFYEVTNEISAEKYVSLSKVLIFVQLLTKHLVKKTSEPHEQVVSNLIDVLQTQIRIRFTDLERHPLYSESTILDPRFKRRGFRTPEAFNKACDILKRRVCEVRLPDELENSLADTEANTVPFATPAIS